MHPAMIVGLTACLAQCTTAISLDSPQPTETLIVDTRVPIFDNGHWVMMSQEQHHELVRKRETADKSSAHTTSASSTTSHTTLVTAPSSSSSALPQPLDTISTSNFSSPACLKFIENLLSNDTFASCYPFSMLLQGSTSFFEAEKSFLSITQVLDATCAANVTVCQSFLDTLADNLIDDTKCGADYRSENSVVVQAYVGLKAYQPLYSAGCLKDTDSEAYCYANAVTNTSTTGDAYLYYLPLNISYPSNTLEEPSCNQCNKQTMLIFQAATAHRSSGIASTYQSGAEALQGACGKRFANVTLAAAVSHGTPSTLVPRLPYVLWTSLFATILWHIIS